MRVAIVFSASMDESGQVPNEMVMKLAFALGNYQQVDVMFPVAVLSSVQREDCVVFKYQDVDPDGLIYVFEFMCVAKFNREMESGDIQIVIVFTIVVQFAGAITTLCICTRMHQRKQ